MKVGEIGEQAAADNLINNGYQIMARRYRSRSGEIDIIAKHKGVIVFVEVKTRRNTAYGVPAEAVNYHKQHKIINTALCYLNQTRNTDVPCRFDILEILLSPNGTFQYNHIVNAFGR
jgi:putative endonuclease